VSCNVLHAVVRSTSAVPSVLRHPLSRDVLWCKVAEQVSPLLKSDR